MVQTRAQKARQQSHNTPVEQEQKPGKQSGQGTAKQPGQGSAADSRDLNAVSSGATSTSRNVRDQKRALEEAQDPVQTNQSRITTLSSDYTVDIVENSDPIALWINEGHWSGNKNVESEMEGLTESEYSEISTGWKRADSGTPVTRSSAKSQAQSVPYASPRYEQRLLEKNCFLTESEIGVSEESKVLYKSLLELKQTFPENSLFHDEMFATTLDDLRGRNEARVIRNIGQLIVPSAAILARKGDKHLHILEESFDDGWNRSIPLTGARPQPDYSVGFKIDAFTKLQLARLSPFVRDIPWGSTERSFFMATNRMFFPFLACEVKCGEPGLNTADRQNAHSMALAVRGILALFRLVKRENELNREILAFSISYDDAWVRIYGHYAVIDEAGGIKYYHHLIAPIALKAQDGQDRWKAYQFTKNIYDVWVPTHLQRIRSIIDQLPDECDTENSKLSDSTSPPQNLPTLTEQEEEEEEKATAAPPTDKENDSNHSSKGDVPAPCKKRKSSATQS
ncbi:hypothetical protein PFICI_12867 [Pestalotiopsis fici W106-1]|uniref:DUF7924 domain-containing protein n=1 Tax=Pestalotiopsis fici (strain W106-1 / CGMCC3.15140) TaxID=1229662 RepID=W3WPY3_PESFW|nr:uncharacterized protein PFICI_12867 [Pestalotiopsis fici W106-1]ETS75923.1 hypothetical protein PFICI_12867 [Pestalotiopsis fici W106-1]